MIEEVKRHLCFDIIPFWKGMRDNTHGGYYGSMDFEQTINKGAVKGCILNSRILWFFSNAYALLQEESLLKEARHSFEFIKEACLDCEYGGIFWSVGYDKVPHDTTKHTYNQAFCIYALSSYYDITGDEESIQIAEDIYRIIEEKCVDEEGYLEAFDREFKPIQNDKLSENGVSADRTMNTLLHVFEAYTEFYRVTKKEEVKNRLKWILDIFVDRIYNPILHRQEVFFDKSYHSLIDLHSYGHDIETAWLLDRGIEVLNDQSYKEKMQPIIKDLTKTIYELAFDKEAFYNECEKGVVDTDRIWWVQAEAVVGFLNGYQKEKSQTRYLDAALSIWEYIQQYMIDKKRSREWFWLVNKKGVPNPTKNMADPWKCPYHNGRMCIEVIRRNVDAT